MLGAIAGDIIGSVHEWADTLACITGGVAEAFYGGVPAPIATRALALLDDRLRETVVKFRTNIQP